MNKLNRKLMEIKQSKLSHDRLVELFDYNPETGIFTNKIYRGANAKAGQESGSLIDGYIKIVIYKEAYRAHRLAWFYVHKKWPKDQIDHINRIRNDNRICNLREADSHINNTNIKHRAEKISGTVGVTWNKPKQNWKAVYEGKFLMCTDNVEEATEAIQQAIEGTFVKREIKRRRREGKAAKHSGVENVFWDESRNQWLVRHNNKHAGRRETLAEALLLKLELADGEHIGGLKELYTPQKIIK